MIIIQLLLVVAIILILVRFLSSRNTVQTRAWKKVFLILLSLLAILFILFPNWLDDIAHAVGVGRGADLLLYSLAVAFIFEQFNGYVKDKDEQQRVVLLARKIALIEANINNKDNNLPDR